jgi:nitrite reductase/ring-hydroxylating ferredoxin subunit
MSDETKTKAKAKGDTLIALCAASDVAPDTPIRVVINGAAYAVFNVNGRFHVTQDACTHGPGSLAEGMIIDDEIECPFHQGRFHIPSGRATAAPCTEPLKVWLAHMIDGVIHVDPHQPHVWVS